MVPQRESRSLRLRIELTNPDASRLHRDWGDGERRSPLLILVALQFDFCPAGALRSVDCACAGQHQRCVEIGIKRDRAICALSSLSALAVWTLRLFKLRSSRCGVQRLTSTRRSGARLMVVSATLPNFCYEREAVSVTQG